MQKPMSVNGQDIIKDIEQKIELLKYQYDLIIIDTFVEMKMNWNARLSQLADTTIFIVESSYFGNIKARQLWEKNKSLLDHKKTKLLFNHYSKYNLYKARLIQNFWGFPILGFISERKWYAQNINRSHREQYGGLLQKKEYAKILDRILHPEKMTEGEWMEILERK